MSINPSILVNSIALDHAVFLNHIAKPTISVFFLPSPRLDIVYDAFGSGSFTRLLLGGSGLLAVFVGRALIPTTSSTARRVTNNKGLLPTWNQNTVNHHAVLPKHQYHSEWLAWLL